MINFFYCLQFSPSFSNIEISRNLDMQELDYNPSKKDLTDAKIHHLLAEELKPYKRVSHFTQASPIPYFNFTVSCVRITFFRCFFFTSVWKKIKNLAAKMQFNVKRVYFINLHCVCATFFSGAKLSESWIFISD